MSKKTKRKKKKQYVNPPLTLLDKGIYLLCIIVSFLGALLLVACAYNVQSLIAFSEPETVAYTSNASILFGIPFLLLIEISAFGLFVTAWGDRKPIFGSKKYNYCESPLGEGDAPLFRRKKYKIKKKQPKKKLVNPFIALWCVCFLLFACLFPLGLFGRDVLCEDNSIERINIVNRTRDTYTADDFSYLTIRACHLQGGWRYVITIIMKDGRAFPFSNFDFDGRIADREDMCLDKMLEIKGLFDPESITIEGREYLDMVADRLGFNESQRDKLNELFAE